MTDTPRCEWPIRRIVRGQVVEGEQGSRYAVYRMGR